MPHSETYSVFICFRQLSMLFYLSVSPRVMGVLGWLYSQANPIHSPMVSSCSVIITYTYLAFFFSLDMRGESMTLSSSFNVLALWMLRDGPCSAGMGSRYRKHPSQTLLL